MFKQYRRTGLSELRLYVLGEDLSKVSVSPEDNPLEDMGMIARNPKNHNDQWYVARKYFEDNLQEVLSSQKSVKPKIELWDGRTAERVVKSIKKVLVD